MATTGHIGSWGLPDLGITEAINQGFRTGQGGSDLIPNLNQPSNIYSSTPKPAWNPTMSQGVNPNLNPNQYTQAAGGQSTLKSYGPAQQPTQPQQQPTQQPTSGGGEKTPPNPQTTYIDGKKLADAIKDGERDQWGNKIGGGQPSFYTSPEGQRFGSEQEYMDLINQAYGSSMGYLNQNEQLLGGAKTAAEKAAEADYQANLAQLGTQRGTAIGGLETQQRKGQTQKEDALAQARRLFSELQRGNVQRFGGATSAGQAASEIQGAEQQRQFGQTARQFNEFTQQIENARRDVESQYQTGIQQLNQSKQQALAKVQSDFTNAIMQINNLRAQTEQQKGMAKLQALQQLRSEAQAIQQQATQFEQQLALMREQANLNIQQYAKTTGSAMSQGQSAYGTFAGQAAQAPSFSQVQGAVGQNLGNQYVGSIRKPEEWQYVGSIGKSVVGRTPDGRTLYSDGTAGWTRY